MVRLVDTNVLVYRFDPRFPEKQQRAMELLRSGIADDSVRIAHQAIVEFVAAVTRVLPGGSRLLAPEEAHREAEELLDQFDVLFPSEPLVRLAIRGASTYRLPWFDAHMWAYAEHHAIPELVSEDFQGGRLYGTVRAVNPFLDGHEEPPPDAPA